MRPTQTLSLIILPATALSLPTSTSPTTPDSATSLPLADECLLAELPNTPENPPACWGFFARTSSPSDYCGASTISTIDIASPSSPEVDWLASCTSLRRSLLAGTYGDRSAANETLQKDFFLADYRTDEFNTLLFEGTAESGGCVVKVRPETPPSSEQVYIGGTDVTDVLASAISEAQARDGNVGIEGTMDCGPDIVHWRVVPA